MNAFAVPGSVSNMGMKGDSSRPKHGTKLASTYTHSKGSCHPNYPQHNKSTPKHIHLSSVSSVQMDTRTCVSLTDKVHELMGIMQLNIRFCCDLLFTVIIMGKVSSCAGDRIQLSSVHMCNRQDSIVDARPANRR
jgi:hypothetical protein